MEELRFLKGDIENLPDNRDNNTIYVASSTTSNVDERIYIGGQELVNINFVTDTVSNCVTKEEFDDVKDKADSAIQSSDLKTINNESIVGEGNITIDVSLYLVVTELPTENINKDKIYLLIVNDESTPEDNRFVEYIWHDTYGWEKIGEYKAEIKLDEYLKIADADAKYMKMDNGKATISMSTNGSMNNYGDNGQAFNAVRECPNSLTGYKINAASFGVKLDGTTAFSHKKYDTFNPATGVYGGAKNTAVLTFSGNLGLRYAKNTGSAADVTDAMFRYVGVIDSPDERQRVYSKAQVDTLISKMKTILSRLGATDEEINSITI